MDKSSRGAHILSLVREKALTIGIPINTDNEENKLGAPSKCGNLTESKEGAVGHLTAESSEKSRRVQDWVDAMPTEETPAMETDKNEGVNTLLNTPEYCRSSDIESYIRSSDNASIITVARFVPTLDEEMDNFTKKDAVGHVPTESYETSGTIQDCLSAMPTKGAPAINKDKNKKINIISNIVLRRTVSSTEYCTRSVTRTGNRESKSEQGFFSAIPTDEVHAIEAGTNEDVKTLLNTPVFSSSSDAESDTDNIGSIEDDSVADPDFIPASDEELSLEIPLQTSIYHTDDIDSNYSLHSKSSTEACSSAKGTGIAKADDSEDTVEIPVQKNNNEGQVESVGKKNYKDRKDFCMYCEKDVSHFARHVSTWHSSEIGVARILSLNNPKERRIEYSKLRKRGNFIRNRSGVKLRPVKRLQSSRVLTSLAEDFLPCKHCLGFYKRKSLYRHTKKCSQNSDVTQNRRQTSQSDGQTTLLLGSLLEYDRLLKKDLFPRMRADDISLLAKKDALICHYAYSYIKGRRSKGNLDVCRQNVRRLAKLVKFAQNRDSNIKSLIDLLRSYHFKMIVEGVNEMAQYNHELEKYQSPTLAMNFGTLLKKCCTLAVLDLLPLKNAEEHIKDLHVLNEIIVKQWADEVSAQASTNLNENRWNKEDLLPLTTDLKKLNNYLNVCAEQQYTKLNQDNDDVRSYYELKDILYCQIILLNRRRPAEVAQLKMQTYKTINLQSSKQDTEFQNCLTETEKILLNTYSRFVIRGKHGHGVPVLLSPTMKKHFELLVSLRHNFVHNNDYIFHTRGAEFIDGTKTLKKYVERCGVTHPQGITATLLRKHLATITQLLQFSKNDMEQLSKFMGHTLKTHFKVYRMSDSIYQTAKVSKLLLLMTEGGAENFKGKQLDEIDIPLTPIIDNEKDIFHELTQEYTEPLETMQVEHTSHSSVEEHKQLEGRSAIARQSWTKEQKQIISNYFKENIRKKAAPKQHKVKEFVEAYRELFKDRKWTSIKAVVYNIYTGKLKVK